MVKSAEVWDLVIIGAGVTGLAAGMYAGRLGLKTVIIGELLGGTITLTDVVENYPGFKKLTGMELAEKIKEHAEEYDIHIKSQKVEFIEKNGNEWTIMTKKEKYFSKTILFATGSKWKELGVPGEQKFKNNGVHTCALCDGPFYRGKKVAVIGGSDSAAKEALVLSDFAEKVYIVYRGNEIHPEPVNKKRVENKINNGKIEMITRSNVLKINGDSTVRSVSLDKDYQGKRELMVDGVFVEIGHIPLSEMAKSIEVKINPAGEIIIDRDAKTNIPGIFAAGDVVDTRFKQAIVGVAEGVLAVYSAYTYINERDL